MELTSIENDIMMESSEIDVIKSFLGKDKIMFEYGSGGSTLYFSQYVKHLYSAEHSQVWSDKIKQRIQNEKITNITLFYAEPDKTELEKNGITGIGITRPPISFKDDMRITYGCNLDEKWAYADTTLKHKVFNDYINLIQGDIKYDIILVDGRARGECAINAYRYLNDDGYLMIHDWFLEEEGYQIVDDNPTDQSIKMPPRYTFPSYKQVLNYYSIVCEVNPEKHNERCHRAGLIVFKKRKFIRYKEDSSDCRYY
jgi:hypothetical protein